jgi:hypothetical protein
MLSDVWHVCRSLAFFCCHFYVSLTRILPSVKKCVFTGQAHS